MTLRIGVYICHCGVNIAGKVRVEEVAAFAARLPHVALAREYKFMCSDPGQEMIEKDIRDAGLNRVVVASCSPRLHEKTFQGACRRAGLNPYLFQMASVREQVSWVTGDPDAATRKAKTLVAAAVGRITCHQPLDTRQVTVNPDVLVVGGGIAGMQAALDIADGGHRVYLVEQLPTIGGHMLQFDKTFPTLDCAACIGTPKMVQTAQHSHVTLYTYSRVTDVAGYIGNYSVTVERKPRYVKEGVCTGCGECAKVCPVSMDSEWDEGLSRRKAIYQAFPQAVPITYCVDKKDRAPCAQACPAHVNVQGYVQLIKQGKYREALLLIRERIPLPGVIGRICPHPCEDQCRRREVEAAVAIRDLKRFAADQVDVNTLEIPAIEEKEAKVAVIGSGPAGLTVAHDLRLAGYQVTVFEALPLLGGMLRYGIPDYRLPPGVLDAEIGYLLRMGIEARTQACLGKNMTLEDLKTEGFEAVFLGIGAQQALSAGMPGESGSRGVLDAVTFLRDVNAGRTTAVGKTVAVVGGGNVAMDAARVAVRLGAASVRLVYRRTRADMPALAEEIEDALEEGIDFRFLTAPVRIHTAPDGTLGLECLLTEPGPPDDSGRRRPVPVAGSECIIPCDTVILAIGQRIDPAAVDPRALPILSTKGWIETCPRSMQTAVPHVFAGGDAVSGPATAVEAIAQGHRAATAIQRYLEGLPLTADTLPEPNTPDRAWQAISDTEPVASRESAPRLTPDERRKDFGEDTGPLSSDQALRESERCLNCGGCCECLECVKVCEAGAIQHDMPSETFTVNVGSIIAATGFDLLDPRPMKPFGYGKYPNVFTSLEFERLNNATGPTGGKILMRDEQGRFTRPPESVAILHCIGSRDIHYHEYCSRVCCMAALKYGHLIHDKLGHRTQIYDFYIDMRCFGKGYEEFFRRCQEEGICFIRGKPAEITDASVTACEDGKLMAIGEDTLLGKPYRIPVDMVILCAAMEARKNSAEIGRILGLSQGGDGFFLEAHPKLGPLNTATDGIFLAGACQSPKDIPDTVAQASGAAAKALSLATSGRVEIPSAISGIDPDICSGCRTCVSLCAYSAIEFDDRRQIAVVNAAMCKGCGSCAAGCPSGAAQVSHFRKKQIFAEMNGLTAALRAVGI